MFYQLESMQVMPGWLVAAAKAAVAAALVALCTIYPSNRFCCSSDRY